MRRLVRRALVLGGIAAGARALRQRRIDENRRRFDLP
jgi:hypothetical protein